MARTPRAAAVQAREEVTRISRLHRKGSVEGWNVPGAIADEGIQASSEVADSTSSQLMEKMEIPHDDHSEVGHEHEGSAIEEFSEPVLAASNTKTVIPAPLLRRSARISSDIGRLHLILFMCVMLTTKRNRLDSFG